MDSKKLGILLAHIAGAALAVGAVAWALPKPKKSKSSKVVALIGDVGGTNVRLSLRELDLETRTSTELKALTKYKSQDLQSFQDGVTKFLADVPEEQKPVVGVVGIAGEVKDNTVRTTNCPHWPISDGNALAEVFKMKKFTFINDFVAAGYGVCLLKDSNVVKLNKVTQDPNGVKVVTGPGTGLGVGFLTRSPYGKCHDVFACEGGHIDLSCVSEDDWQLRQFAVDFIQNSENVENQRGRGDTKRISIERLCAGPAVPLIYAYMKKTHPDVKSPLGDKIKFDDMTSGDIISAGMAKAEEQDPLCKMVVEKFAEIFACAVGNCALSYLPYGGIYLIGGVTNGISELMIHDHYKFMHYVQQKGRLASIARRIPVYYVNPDIELGILGSEECCFRDMNCF